MALATVVGLRACEAWATSIEHHLGHGLGIGAAPFVGRWRLAPASRLLLPVAVAAGVLGLAPRLVRGPWARLVVATGAVWVAWVGALALVDGPGFVTEYLGSRYDYLAGVAAVGSPGGFLAHFTQRIGAYPTHVRGHAPGLVIVLWVLRQTGLGGTGGALALCLVGGIATVTGVLVATRSVAGEAWARRAALFLALAPAAVVATNGDLVYAGLGAWAVALVALAAEPGRSPRRRVASAVAGGALAGLALLGSYGMALLAVPLVAVVVGRRRVVPLVVAGAAALAVVVLPLVWGFWWLDGLAATRQQYWSGLAALRPGPYFAVADVVVAAALIGPVALAGIGWLRGPGGRGARLLVASGLAMIGLAVASQMAKGEVERIWQPFYPWVTVAAAGLVVGTADGGGERFADRSLRWWLGVQAGTALVLAAVWRSPW